MKILICSDLFPPRALGGAEIMASRLAEQYFQQGHQVSVITTVHKSIEQGVEMRPEGYRMYKVYAPKYPQFLRAYLSLYNPWTVKSVSRILDQECPDVLHAQNVHQFLSYHVFKLAHERGLPSLVTLQDAMAVDYGKFHQGISLEDKSDCPQIEFHISPWRTFRVYRSRYFPFRNLLTRWYLNNYTRYRVTLSRELRQVLESNGVNCTHIVPNAVDPQTFEVTDQQVRDMQMKHGLSDQKVILFAGRLSFWKGGEKVVRALPQIIQKIPQARLFVLGRQEGFSQKMQQLAAQLGVGDRLVFSGWLSGSELAAAYSASDVVVVPSIYLEPFAMITIEAMAARKPVVATCFGGPKEIVVDGETGYVVNPLNINSLASRIVALLKEQHLAQQMGEAGFQRLLENFTLEKCANQYLALFKQLTDG